MFMRIHISLLSCRGEEKMPARPCPIRSVRSGPVRPVCPVRAPWAQGTGSDRTDPTGPDTAGPARWPRLAWHCPVRPVRASWAHGTGADRTDRTGPDWTGPDRTGQGQARLGQRAVPALSCPVRSVRSAPVPWAQGARTGQTGRTGRDRTDRMEQGRAGIFSSPLQLSNDM